MPPEKTWSDAAAESSPSDCSDTPPPSPTDGLSPFAALPASPLAWPHLGAANLCSGKQPRGTAVRVCAGVVAAAVIGLGVLLLLTGGRGGGGAPGALQLLGWSAAVQPPANASTPVLDPNTFAEDLDVCNLNFYEAPGCDGAINRTEPCSANITAEPHWALKTDLTCFGGFFFYSRCENTPSGSRQAYCPHPPGLIALGALAAFLLVCCGCVRFCRVGNSSADRWKKRLSMSAGRWSLAGYFAPELVPGTQGLPRRMRAKYATQRDEEMIHEAREKELAEKMEGGLGEGLLMGTMRAEPASQLPSPARGTWL